jgi:hypothetical protein
MRESTTTTWISRAMMTSVSLDRRRFQWGGWSDTFMDKLKKDGAVVESALLNE